MRIDPFNLSEPEKLLWENGVVEPAHIDLQALAHHLGAKVVIEPLEGCEARLLTAGDRAIITLSEFSSFERQRFSLGHELAHWIWDQNRGAFLCVSDDISPQDDQTKQIEAQANFNASQLILPDYLVRPRIEGRSPNLNLADDLGSEFTSSLTAAAIKVTRLTPQATCLVCHESTKRKWFKPSKGFPKDFWPIRELYPDTDAFSLTFQPVRGISKVKRSPGDHWLEGRGMERLEVEAQSVRLATDTVLTMLRLI